ncbi:MAG: enoyl-CoA hydratase/isomerase family protein [Aliishimia sp.]
MSEINCIYDGSAAVLTVANEPKLNALTMEMLLQLEDHLVAIERNNDVRAVILTAAGAKAFCCGADIAEWGPLSPADFARFWVRDGHRVFDRLARLSKPVIGALNGHAFGGGLELAACCDIRILTPRTTLALPEGKVGIVPGWSGTQRLMRLLPEAVVKEMAFFGRRITANRALALGFAAEVSDDPLTTAKDLVDTLTDMSPRAAELSKTMIHAAVGEDRAAAIEALASAAAAASDDCTEGVSAFLEKRSPKFTGQ